MTALTRELHCGDNLDVLRSIPSGAVQVVYSDPPFNSGQDWHMKPAAAGGRASLAFTDTWKWTPDADQQYKELTAAGSVQAPALEWFRSILDESGTLAYLVHMAARFPELHRVLSPAGGLFLHVDDTMSHYLKILLDFVFGPENFVGQIVWKRSSGSNSAKRSMPRVHDTILVFRRSAAATWSTEDDSDDDCGSSGDVWLDIPPLNAQAKERLGYPTQKPLALLLRIVSLISRPGDVLLDPNCGCGTSLAAAQQLGLGWIGIDLNPAAIDLTQARLRAAGADFQVHGADVAAPEEGALW